MLSAADARSPFAARGINRAATDGDVAAGGSITRCISSEVKISGYFLAYVVKFLYLCIIIIPLIIKQLIIKTSHL